MGRAEGVGLGVHHRVHSQDVRQWDLFVVRSGGVRLVHGETLSVQPPVKLLALGVQEQGWGGGI